LWSGEDEFTHLNDRESGSPLALPAISQSKRVVLVRHGQSTWNAAGRIQGSTNFAVLTDKGVSQAEVTKNMLANEKFDAMFRSPLARSHKTGEIIWGDRQQPVEDLPSLREVDLYSFQGLLKGEGKARFGEQFLMWQKDPDNFVIDDHYPVRELWYRASLCWQRILTEEYQQTLVVAHNAINQGLVNTAIGLPPSYFRCFLQSNAAVTVLDFAPNGDKPPLATLERMNNSPGSPFEESAGRATGMRVVLVRHGATYTTEDGIMLGLSKEAEELSALGHVQARKTAELLMDAKIKVVITSGSKRAKQTADEICMLQPLAGNTKPPTVDMGGEGGALRCWNTGQWEGYSVSEATKQKLPEDCEPLDQLWERASEAWQYILQEAGQNQGAVVVVADDALVSSLLAKGTHLGREGMRFFRMDTGSVSVVDFPDGVDNRGVLRTTNYTSHMGRWSVPITGEDTLDVCGIDGCF